MGEIFDVLSMAPVELLKLSDVYSLYSAAGDLNCKLPRFTVSIFVMRALIKWILSFYCQVLNEVELKIRKEVPPDS